MQTLGERHYQQKAWLKCAYAEAERGRGGLQESRVRQQVLCRAWQPQGVHNLLLCLYPSIHVKVCRVTTTGLFFLGLTISRPFIFSSRISFHNSLMVRVTLPPSTSIFSKGWRTLQRKDTRNQTVPSLHLPMSLKYWVCLMKDRVENLPNVLGICLTGSGKPWSPWRPLLKT